MKAAPYSPQNILNISCRSSRVAPVVYGYKGSEDDVAYDRGNRQDRRRHYSHRHIVAGEIAAEDTLEKSLPVLAERLIISS